MLFWVFCHYAESVVLLTLSVTVPMNLWKYTTLKTKKYVKQNLSLKYFALLCNIWPLCYGRAQWFEYWLILPGVKQNLSFNFFALLCYIWPLCYIRAQCFEFWLILPGVLLGRFGYFRLLTGNSLMGSWVCWYTWERISWPLLVLWNMGNSIARLE
jgi:hypothetical protein